MTLLNTITISNTPWVILSSSDPIHFMTKYADDIENRSCDKGEFFAYQADFEKCFLEGKQIRENDRMHSSQTPHLILTTDRFVYRPGENVNIFALASGIEDEISLEIYQSDVKIKEERLKLSPAGMGHIEFDPPGPGKYVIRPNLNRIWRRAEFMVEPFSFSPLELGIKSIIRNEKALRVTLSINLLSEPYTGEVSIRIPHIWKRDGDQDIILSAIAEKGILEFSFKPQNWSPSQAIVTLPKGHSGNVLLQGSGDYEGRIKDIIPFQTKKSVSLISTENTHECRGLHVEMGEESDTPFEITNAIGDQIVLQCLDDFWRVYVAIYSVVKGGEVSVVQYEDIKCGDIKTLRAFEPLTAVEVLAIKDSLPNTRDIALKSKGHIEKKATNYPYSNVFVARGYVITHPKAKLEVTVPEKVTLGSKLILQTKVKAPNPQPISVLVSVRDARLDTKDIGFEYAKELWNSIAAYCNRDIISSDPFIDEFRRDMLRLDFRVMTYTRIGIWWIIRALGEEFIISSRDKNISWSDILNPDKLRFNPEYNEIFSHLVNRLIGVLRNITEQLDLLDGSKDLTWRDFVDILCLNSVRANAYWVLSNNVRNMLEKCARDTISRIYGIDEKRIARNIAYEIAGFNELLKLRDTINNTMNYLQRNMSILEDEFQTQKPVKLIHVYDSIEKIHSCTDNLFELMVRWSQCTIHTMRFVAPRSVIASVVSDSIQQQRVPIVDSIMEESRLLSDEHSESVIPSIRDELGTAHFEIINGNNELDFSREIALGGQIARWAVTTIAKVGFDIIVEKRIVETHAENYIEMDLPAAMVDGEKANCCMFYETTKPADIVLEKDGRVLSRSQILAGSGTISAEIGGPGEYIASLVHGGKVEDMRVFQVEDPTSESMKYISYRFVRKGYRVEDEQEVTVIDSLYTLGKQIADSLVRYPYGCAEQTSSTMYGLAYSYRLSQKMEWAKIDDPLPPIKSGIQRLVSFFDEASGHFSYWPHRKNGHADISKMVLKNMAPIFEQGLIKGTRLESIFDKVVKNLEKEGEREPYLKCYSESLATPPIFDGTIRSAANCILSGAVSTDVVNHLEHNARTNSRYGFSWGRNQSIWGGESELSLIAARALLKINHPKYAQRVLVSILKNLRDGRLYSTTSNVELLKIILDFGGTASTTIETSAGMKEVKGCENLMGPLEFKTDAWIREERVETIPVKAGGPLNATLQIPSRDLFVKDLARIKVTLHDRVLCPMCRVVLPGMMVFPEGGVNLQMKHHPIQTYWPFESDALAVRPGRGSIRVEVFDLYDELLTTVLPPVEIIVKEKKPDTCSMEDGSANQELITSS